MRFIADTMLGKLSRWLRLLGYDVDYRVDFEDDDLIASAKGRTLLTRDRALFERAKSEGLSALLISGTGIKGQLLQLKEEAGIELRDTPEFARCPLCNGEIESVEKEKLKENVPENLNDFWICKTCKNVYWEGGHWKNIKETIKEVKDRGKDVQNPKR
jgi:uncharacterized protein with PIN domain